MKTSRLRNKFLRDRTENNQNNFKLQRNFCKKLLTITKKSYYSNLEIKKVTDNKTFWKAIIPVFTKRPLKGEKNNLIENGKRISNDTEFCNIVNGFFSNIISKLNIPKKYHCFLNDMDSDSVLFSTHSKTTRTLRISKVKNLIRHFLLRILTLM